MGEDAPPPPSFPPCRRDSPHFTGEKIGVQSGEATPLKCVFLTCVCPRVRAFSLRPSKTGHFRCPLPACLAAPLQASRSGPCPDCRDRWPEALDLGGPNLAPGPPGQPGPRVRTLAQNARCLALAEKPATP